MSVYLQIRSITITTKEALSSLLPLSPSQGEFQASATSSFSFTHDPQLLSSSLSYDYFKMKSTCYFSHMEHVQNLASLANIHGGIVWLGGGERGGGLGGELVELAGGDAHVYPDADRARGRGAPG